MAQRERSEPATGWRRPGHATAGRIRADPVPPLHLARSRVDGVLGLQRTAGNRAVSTVLQRVDTKTEVLDPRIDEVGDNLTRFCDAGTEIAWDLYRALLQLQTDEANARYGRMSTDPEITRTVLAARDAHQRAVQSFANLRADGGTHLRAAKAEAAKDAPDAQAVTADTTALLRCVEDAARQITAVAERAWNVAIQAEEGGHLVAARHAFRAADGAEEVAQAERPLLRVHSGRAPVDALGVVYGVGVDAGANTVGGGVYGNALSVVGVVAQEGSIAAGLSSGTSMVFAPLGVLCSSVGIVLGVRGALRSGERKTQLELLQSKLADPHAREAVRYAIEQKDRKRRNRWISTGAAVAGLAAGIAGCVAIGVATFGIGALVIGVVAAAIGLGILAYRIYRKSERARQRKMKHFAKSIIATAVDTSGDPVDRDLARDHIRDLVGAPASGDYGTTSVSGLASALADRAASRRSATAEALLAMLLNGRRSERRDAGLVLEALKLDPEKLCALAEAGKGEAALEQVKGKLGSW